MPEVDSLIETIHDRIDKYSAKKNKFSASLKIMTILIAVLGAISSLASVLNLTLQNSLIKDVILVLTTISITILSSILNVFDIQGKLTTISLSLDNYTYLASLVEFIREKLDKGNYNSSELFSDIIKDIIVHFTHVDSENIELSEYVDKVRKQTEKKIDPSVTCPTLDHFPKILEISHDILNHFHIFVYDNMVQLCGESGIPEFDLKYIQNMNARGDVCDLLEINGKFYCFEVRVFADKNAKSYYIILFAEISEDSYSKMKSTREFPQIHQS